MIYQHKAFARFQDWLEAGDGLRKELSTCIYCQTMQAAIASSLIYLVISPDTDLFVLLANIVIAPWVNYLCHNFVP